MPSTGRVLTPSAAQGYYNWLGKKQDSQGFYENPALDDLVAHASFHEAQSVFEFGCGTGKFAARLLEDHLPTSATYLGCDLSPIMIGLAKSRIMAYVKRAQVVLSDGGAQFPLSDRSVDRVVSNYVLDLLSEVETRRFFSEAHRTLMPGGKVCLASLTAGTNLLSRTVSSLWMALFRLSPVIVGGCRPIDLDSYVDHHLWQVAHRRTVAPFGVPSQVVILDKKGMPNNGRERAAQPRRSA